MSLKQINLITILVIVSLVTFLSIKECNAQARSRTTCYDVGPTRICETFDGMGNTTSKTRCYQVGRDTRCDTQHNNGAGPAPLPVPYNRSR